MVNSFEIKSSLSNFRRCILPAGIILYVICYWLFYPQFYSLQDEQIYLAKAYQFSQGVFFETISNAANYQINKYPPGQSLLLSILLKFGYTYIYLLNPSILILLTLIFADILRKNNIPAYFALLILFHPVMFLFSRTLMSDISAAFFFLLAIWFFLYGKDKYFIGALALGFTVSLRVSMIPFSGLFLLYILLKYKDSLSHVLQTMGGFILGATPFLYYILNSSDLFSGGYVHDANQAMTFGKLFHRSYIYLLSLNLIYPLMFVIGLINRYKGDAILKLICALSFLFFIFFWAYPTNSIARSIIMNQRYFLFIIGPLLIGYSLYLSRNIITSEIKFISIVVVLLTASILISIKHQDVLDQNYAFNKIIYKNTTENSLLVTDDKSVELVQEVFGKRRIINTELVRDISKIKQQIMSSGLSDIFIILLDRHEEDSVNIQGPLYSLLELFRSEEVATYERGWNLKIVRIFPQSALEKTALYGDTEL